MVTTPQYVIASKSDALWLLITKSAFKNMIISIIYKR